MLQFRGWIPTTKNYSTKNVNSSEVEKSKNRGPRAQRTHNSMCKHYVPMGLERTGDLEPKGLLTVCIIIMYRVIIMYQCV